VKRQFGGLSMSRQLAYAREYAARFGAEIHLAGIANPVRVTGVPSMRSMSPQDAEALRELDDRCHAEWRAVPGLRSAE
jgi:hypothetical protein